MRRLFLLPVFSRSLLGSGESFKIELQVLSHSLHAISCLLVRGSLYCSPPHPHTPWGTVSMFVLRITDERPTCWQAFFTSCGSVLNRGHTGPWMCGHQRSLMWQFLSWMFSRGHCFEWGNLVKRRFSRSLNFWIIHFSACVSWADYFHKRMKLSSIWRHYLSMRGSMDQYIVL